MHAYEVHALHSLHSRLFYMCRHAVSGDFVSGQAGLVDVAPSARVGGGDGGDSSGRHPAAFEAESQDLPELVPGHGLGRPHYVLGECRRIPISLPFFLLPLQAEYRKGKLLRNFPFCAFFLSIESIVGSL